MHRRLALEGRPRHIRRRLPRAGSSARRRAVSRCAPLRREDGGSRESRRRGGRAASFSGFRPVVQSSTGPTSRHKFERHPVQPVAPNSSVNWSNQSPQVKRQLVQPGRHDSSVNRSNQSATIQTSTGLTSSPQAVNWSHQFTTSQPVDWSNQFTSDPNQYGARQLRRRGSAEALWEDATSMEPAGVIFGPVWYYKK